MRFLAAILAALLLAGCAPFGDTKQAHRYYVLEPHLESAMRFPVRIGNVSAASFYDTEAMVYSRSPGTRGYYQLNSWTEAPARRIAELIQQRSSGEGPALNLHLVEMYHDASTSPGKVHVSVAAEAGRERRTFTAEAPAAAFDAAGAVKGFNDAVGRILQEIQPWSVSAAR